MIPDRLQYMQQPPNSGYYYHYFSDRQNLAYSLNVGGVSYL